MMGTLGKGDKSVIQRKLLFKFYNDGFISTSNSEQEEQTSREKYVFYCSLLLWWPAGLLFIVARNLMMGTPGK